MSKTFVSIVDLVNNGRPNVLMHLGRGDVIQARESARHGEKTFAILGKSGDTLAVVPHADGLKVGSHADGIAVDDPSAIAISLGTVTALYTRPVPVATVVATEDSTDSEDAPIAPEA